MNADDERTRSIWIKTAPLLEAPPLAGDAVADVAVVGGGIAGVTAAYELMRAGRKVILVDRGAFGGGMTGRTTAHLASALDDYYHELIRIKDRDQAAAYYRGQAAAIDRIEAIARDEQIDCGFRRLPGYLFLAEGDTPDTLDRELAACTEIGFPGVARVDRAPVPGLPASPALRFPGQGRIHATAFLNGVIRALQRGGAVVHGDTAIQDVREEAGGVVVEAEGGRIRAGAAVIATNGPIVDKLTLHARMAPYRTYAVALEVPPGSVEDALVWDTGDPYHYVRLEETDGRLTLIVGGEDHKTGEADDGDRRLDALVEWTRRAYPMAGAEIARWSGQVMETADFLPFTGRYPGSTAIYVHTGDSGQGITNGVMGAMVIRDLLLGRANDVATVIDPARSTVRRLGEIVSENLTVAKNFAERVTGGDVASDREIPAGQGALVRHGLSKVAVYRDEAGVLHRLSATCTHAGCLVHWNGLEGCWDCPCHGSQFAPDGAVLHGPATAPLKRLDD
jgi:glycine/D-amino acid oxidase-like deaminating enzyme/nitrite reductase/ring-hydroxylating ferredoxin subunit